MKLWLVSSIDQESKRYIRQVVASETEEDAFKVAFSAKIECLGEGVFGMREGCIAPDLYHGVIPDGLDAGFGITVSEPIGAKVEKVQ